MLRGQVTKWVMVTAAQILYKLRLTLRLRQHLVLRQRPEHVL